MCEGLYRLLALSDGSDMGQVGYTTTFDLDGFLMGKKKVWSSGGPSVVTLPGLLEDSGWCEIGQAEPLLAGVTQMEPSPLKVFWWIWTPNNNKIDVSQSSGQNRSSYISSFRGIYSHVDFYCIWILVAVVQLMYLKGLTAHWLVLLQLLWNFPEVRLPRGNDFGN